MIDTTLDLPGGNSGSWTPNLNWTVQIAKGALPLPPDCGQTTFLSALVVPCTLQWKIIRKMSSIHKGLQWHPPPLCLLSKRQGSVSTDHRSSTVWVCECRCLGDRDEELDPVDADNFVVNCIDSWRWLWRCRWQCKRPEFDCEPERRRRWWLDVDRPSPPNLH